MEIEKYSSLMIGDSLEDGQFIIVAVFAHIKENPTYIITAPTGKSTLMSAIDLHRACFLIDKINSHTNPF